MHTSLDLPLATKPADRGGHWVSQQVSVTPQPTLLGEAKPFPMTPSAQAKRHQNTKRKMFTEKRPFSLDTECIVRLLLMNHLREKNRVTGGPWKSSEVPES